MKTRCLVVLTAVCLSLVFADSSRSAVYFDKASQTWTVSSGDVDYRLKKEGDQVYLDYFGPAEKKAWPEIVPDTWRPQPLRRNDIRFNDGARTLTSADLTLADASINRNEENGQDVLTLHFHRPPDWPYEISVSYTGMGDTGVITRQVTGYNLEEFEISLDPPPSLSWQLPAGPYELTYLYGGWGKERQVAQETLTNGMKSFISRRGRSTNGYSPWFCLHNPQLGVRYLAQLAWSGNWEARFERQFSNLPYEMEELEVDLGVRFDGGGRARFLDEFTSPVVAFTAVTGDLDDAANRLHRYQRQFVIPQTPANTPRLVHFNSWYPFQNKFTLDDMKRCVDAAAELGAEAYVVDAGWFNKKNWSREIGDWQEDKNVFPNGIIELSDYVHGKGLKFGMWVEIENLGIDSQMSREHPDWCLQRDGKPMLSGERYHLNFAYEEVREWARSVLDRLVKEVKIDWVKIDYNIDAGENFDNDGDPPTSDTLISHIRAYYRWLDELRADYPNLVVENCSSGGLRFDLGIIGHTHTTWISDVVHPLPSLQLAYGSTLEFAPEICNHWMVGDDYEGRVDLTKPAGWWDFLFRVPMNGQFGVSSRIFDWSPEFMERAKANVTLYKRIRDLIAIADTYHLTPPPPNQNPEGWMAIQYAAPDKSRSVLNAYRLAKSEEKRSFRLRGLDENKTYRIRENGEDRGEMRGDALMKDGLPVSLDAEWRASIFELEAE